MRLFTFLKSFVRVNLRQIGFLAIIITFLSSSIFANNNREMLKYEDVVSVDSTSASTLFKRAKKWTSTFLTIAENVVFDEGGETKSIYGNVSMPFKQSFITGSGMTEGSVSYTFLIACRDGRYKYKFEKFVHLAHGGSGYRKISFGVITTDEEPVEIYETQKWSVKVWKDIKEVIYARIGLIISSLKNEMQKPIESETNDW